jgi:hypothetical protein
MGAMDNIGVIGRSNNRTDTEISRESVITRSLHLVNRPLGPRNGFLALDREILTERAFKGPFFKVFEDILA